MPQYIYKCLACNHMEMQMHSIEACNSVRACPFCAAEMYRVIQRTAVNWQGLKPSAGELSPALRQHLASVPQKREALAEAKEKHERNSKLQGAA